MAALLVQGFNGSQLRLLQLLRRRQLSLQIQADDGAHIGSAASQPRQGDLAAQLNQDLRDIGGGAVSSDGENHIRLFRQDALQGRFQPGPVGQLSRRGLESPLA